MPPEAFEGKTDARSDVYSLGLTLYEMLAFRAAFDEKERNRLIKQVTEAEPERLGKLNRHVPQDLQTIVHKAIDKDPARRYSSAGALAADLQRFVDDEPIQARRLGQLERLGRWSRRHKAVAALLATLATVLTVGFFVMAVLWSRAERSADVARTNEQTAQRPRREGGEGTRTRRRPSRRRRRKRAERRTRSAEQLAREDYVNRVNRAYREIQDDNIALAEDLLHGCEPGRRGWEWHFVERLCNSERLVIDLGELRASTRWPTAPTGPGPSPARGQQSACHPARGGSAPRRVGCELRANDGRPWPGPGARSTSVAVSPDGKKVAAGCRHGLVVVWDVATGRASGPGLNRG